MARWLFWLEADGNNYSRNIDVQKMTEYVRGPFWDGAWLLSGIPNGCVFLLLIKGGISAHVLVFWLIILTQTAHTIAPMMLAWSHRGFRAHMLRHRLKFIALPIAIILLATLAGFGGGLLLPAMDINPIHYTMSAAPDLSSLSNPFMAMFAMYLLWNGYHFGKQSFGIASIYRRKAGISGGRRIDLIYFCGVTWAAMLMPFIPRLMWAFHDWTGLLSRADVDYVKPAYFILAVLAIGAMLWREITRTVRAAASTHNPSGSVMCGSAECVGIFVGSIPRLSRAAQAYVSPRTILILTDGLSLVLIWYAGLWGFAIIALNHWLTAIGLASHVAANERMTREHNPGSDVPNAPCIRTELRLAAPWSSGPAGVQLSDDTLRRSHRNLRFVWSQLLRSSAAMCSRFRLPRCRRVLDYQPAAAFAITLIALGLALFAALFVRWPLYFGEPMALNNPYILDPERWLSFTVTAVGFRLGLGFVHFLYDKWLYKMSALEVRQTIGRELLYGADARKRLATVTKVAYKAHA